MPRHAVAASGVSAPSPDAIVDDPQEILCTVAADGGSSKAVQ